ncbi:hypothetical protein JNW88_02370 [Micromonospora sp. ATA32]|nr:hypothetical protein [Micromonospora sp. ATA32]
MLEAATQIVTATVDELILNRNHVGALLSRFEDAMRQWRHDGDNLDNPIRWPITSEREVQNIIWIMPVLVALAGKTGQVSPQPMVTMTSDDSAVAYSRSLGVWSVMSMPTSLSTSVVL